MGDRGGPGFCLVNPCAAGGPAGSLGGRFGAEVADESAAMMVAFSSRLGAVRMTGNYPARLPHSLKPRRRVSPELEGGAVKGPPHLLKPPWHEIGAGLLDPRATALRRVLPLDHREILAPLTGIEPAISAFLVDVDHLRSDLNQAEGLGPDHTPKIARPPDPSLLPSSSGR